MSSYEYETSRQTPPQGWCMAAYGTAYSKRGLLRCSFRLSGQCETPWRAGRVIVQSPALFCICTGYESWIVLWGDGTHKTFAQKRGCTSTTDGYTNTNKMPKSSSRILAGPWCLNHGTGWYCPARGELVTLANNVNKVNSTLSSGGYHNLDTQFWSSTESSSDKAYVVTLGAMSSSDYVGNYYAVSKGQNYHVCAIKQFWRFFENLFSRWNCYTATRTPLYRSTSMRCEVWPGSSR